MKILLSSIITGVVGGLSASTGAFLLFRYAVKKLLDKLHTQEVQLDFLQQNFNILDKALGKLDAEIDKLKKHDKV
jgi:hypothetical protein